MLIPTKCVRAQVQCSEWFPALRHIPPSTVHIHSSSKRFISKARDQQSHANTTRMPSAGAMSLLRAFCHTLWPPISGTGSIPWWVGYPTKLRRLRISFRPKLPLQSVSVMASVGRQQIGGASKWTNLRRWYLVRHFMSPGIYVNRKFRSKSLHCFCRRRSLRPHLFEWILRHVRIPDCDPYGIVHVYTW